ncbi:MAG TPA: MBL fold metallo-hydrolase [Vicinamibacterales bacterium]|nr:MBL fold metallo-hydrolase [Vicinamibacterales bacterium]
MHTLARGLDYVDLNFLGRPEIIATAILQAPGGVALVDPGPQTTLDGLLKSLQAQGIATRDIRQVLLTHIHLDHAGATGTLVAKNPAIEVYVHEHGARHMSDPSKLLASAGRLYGDDMRKLWGEVAPVPSDRLRVLKGGERIAAGGRELEVGYTPGHAIHHVTYFDRSTSIAFTGDVAGIRRGEGAYIMPPAPPPDIDLEAWRKSADLILSWEPDTLFLTHFGPYRGARPHFQQLFERIDQWSALVKRLLRDDTIDDAERERRFVAECLQDIRRAVGDIEAERYSRAGRLDYSWQGLARYWRRAKF